MSRENNNIAYNSMTDTEFKAMIQKWLEENYPERLRNPPYRLGIKETRVWYEMLSKKGWLVPGWPQEYGGMGLDSGKQLAMMEVMEQYGCARLPDSGLTMLGPLIINYGTQAQKDYFLPKIISGEHIWCQGYSEPNAGSDLASLRTEAIRDGDEWVINGQKTWTTMGTEADWIFVLAKTDTTVKPQVGISFLLVPIKTSGVEVRPITDIGMRQEFCEVFFTDVRIPAKNLVGEMNHGWSMAKALLGFERIFLGSPKQATNALELLELLAKHMGVWQKSSFKIKFSQLNHDLDCHNALYKVFAEQVRRGETLGADVSMLKIHQSELFVRINELGLAIANEGAGLLHPLVDDEQLNPAGLFIRSLQTPIYGGTNEIQRNILAKHILKLPA